MGKIIQNEGKHSIQLHKDESTVEINWEIFFSKGRILTVSGRMSENLSERDKRTFLIKGVVLWTITVNNFKWWSSVQNQGKRNCSLRGHLYGQSEWNKLGQKTVCLQKNKLQNALSMMSSSGHIDF